MKTNRHRFFAAAAAAAALFTLYSATRELLVPFNATVERAEYLLTGDEPSYLLTAQAIASGDGENVRNVSEAATYSNYTARVYSRGHHTRTWGDYKRLGVKHHIDRSALWDDGNLGWQVIPRSPLVSFFAAPFAFMPKNFRWSVLLAQSLVCVAFVVLAVIGIRTGDKRRQWLAAFACVAFMGSLPVVCYANQVFPETLTGVLLASAALLSCRESRLARIVGRIALVISPWGTARVIVGAGMACAVLFLRDLKVRDRLACAIPVLGWALYFGYNLWLWGAPSPPNANPNAPLTLSLIPKGLLINFFNRDVGLFLLNPAALAGAACLAALSYKALVKRDWESETLPLLLMFAGVALVVAAFPDYRAGHCPAGRYQVVQSYLLLAAVLLFLEKAEAAALRVATVALLVFGCVALVMGVTISLNLRSWHEKVHPCLRYYYGLRIWLGI